VKVEVIHRLASISSTIDDESVAGFFQAFRSGDTGGRENEVPGQVAVVCLQVGQAGDVFSGDDQNVGRGLGVNVPEGQEFFIAMHLGAWYFACGDVAEETGTHLDPFPENFVQRLP
jgi:hypothetical protein